MLQAASGAQARSPEARRDLLGEEPHRADDEVVRHAARSHPGEETADAGVPEARDRLGAAVRIQMWKPRRPYSCTPPPSADANSPDVAHPAP